MRPTASCKPLDEKKKKKERNTGWDSKGAKLLKKDLLTLHGQQFYQVWMTFFFLLKRDHRMVLKVTGKSYSSHFPSFASPELPGVSIWT